MSRRRQRKRHEPLEVRELVWEGRVLVRLEFGRSGTVAVGGDQDSSGPERERAAAWLADELTSLTHDEAYDLLWR